MSTVFEMLDAEWQRLRHDQTAARHLHDVCQVAGGARTLADVESYVRAASALDADRVLLALVARAVGDEANEGNSDDRRPRRCAGHSGSAGDDGGPDDLAGVPRRGGRAAGGAGRLAARVLLQLLMPGARRMARRWWALGDPDERAAAAVAAVYDRIRRYPLARRPGRVAANVLLDAERQLRRAAAGAAVTPLADPAGQQVGDGRHDIEPAPHPAVELTEVLRDAVHDRIIDAGDAELIARSRIGGERVVDIAERRGARARTLWDRRQRAEHALITAALHRCEAAV